MVYVYVDFGKTKEAAETEITAEAENVTEKKADSSNEKDEKKEGKS